MRAIVRPVTLGLSLMLGLASGCAHGAAETTRSSMQPAARGGTIDELVDRGLALKAGGRCREALTQGFLPAIQRFETEFQGTAIEAQRENVLLEAMNRVRGNAAFTMTRLGPDGRMVQVIGDYYPDVLYLAGYCMVELGDFDRGQAMLERALQIIPDDALYLSEIGHILQVRRDFVGAIDVFQRAVTSARALEARAPDADPLGIRIVDIRHRAMRGLGFSLIEIRRFDEAAALYQEILRENPEDERATQELRYIDQQRGGPNSL